MQPSLFPQQHHKEDGATGSGSGSGSGRSVAAAHLNPAQREAVCAPPGPILVIAGAGSGKTRTLVHRLAWLVEQGIPPEELLLLTFTRKAAQEMVERAGYLLNDSCRRVTGGTFHATANLLLRRYARYVGYQTNFTILDQGDAEGIINLLKSSLGLGGVGKRFPSRRLILGILSKAVNVGVSVTDLVEAEHGHLVEFLDDILAINEHYHKFKLAHGLMDYDDLLLNWRELLRENLEVREELAARFKAILVDEYQDTNPIQAEIVRLMAAPRNHVMAVGDDAQSIYSFRGADFRNIMEFPDQFPGTRLIRLEENYRSTPEILEVGNAIIAPAPVRYPKKLFSKLEAGVKPLLHTARNEGAQARFVVEKIGELRRRGVRDKEMAVLFRSGFHSYKLELELTAAGIPFEKRGGQKLTESAHIKDLLVHFRVLCNPADRLSWNRILLLIDKIGPKTARNIIDRLPLTSVEPVGSAEFAQAPESSDSAKSAKSANSPESAALPEQEPPGDLLAGVRAALAAYPAGKSWQAGIKRLLELLEDLAAAGSSPSALLELVLLYYQPIFQRLYPDDYPRRQRDLEQLRPLLGAYDDIRDFLADAALDPPGPEEGSGEEGGRLILSTVHSAKGLEWDTVFVIHLVEGKFPSGQSSGPEQYEEERRLLYVAATRAKNRLFLLYPREAMGADRRSTYCEPSSFLAPLPPGLLATNSRGSDYPATPSPPAYQASADSGGRFSPRYKQAPTPGADSQEVGSDFAVGARVRHPFFGPGVLEKKSGGRTVEVRFDRHGRKTLHLDYAKLEKL